MQRGQREGEAREREVAMRSDIGASAMQAHSGATGSHDGSQRGHCCRGPKPSSWMRSATVQMLDQSVRSSLHPLEYRHRRVRAVCARATRSRLAPPDFGRRRQSRQAAKANCRQQAIAGGVAGSAAAA
jgi:hypothetical protein